MHVGRDMNGAKTTAVGTEIVTATNKRKQEYDLIEKVHYFRGSAAEPHCVRQGRENLWTDTGQQQSRRHAGIPLHGKNLAALLSLLFLAKDAAW